MGGEGGVHPIKTPKSEFQQTHEVMGRGAGGKLWQGGLNVQIIFRRHILRLPAAYGIDTRIYT